MYPDPFLKREQPTFRLVAITSEPANPIPTRTPGRRYHQPAHWSQCFRIPRFRPVSRKAPAYSKVIKDESHLDSCCGANLNALVANIQIAKHAGPWDTYPDAEDVAATDTIVASPVKIAETLRVQLGMR